MTPPVSDAEIHREQLMPRILASRAALHRYCSRMTSSPLDGEDVVQETLVQASDSLHSLQDSAKLDQWLFRIAYHKCVDFLRRENRSRENTVSFAEEQIAAPVYDDIFGDDAPIDAGLARLVYTLPPRERAAVLLKDVLEYDLAAIAAIVDSTAGAVKSALHRGRAKLRTLRDTVSEPANAFSTESATDARLHTLFKSYVECFNNRDWDALRQLIQSDAKFELVGVLTSTMDGAGRKYFTNYAAFTHAWRLALARSGGEWIVVHERRDAGRWVPMTALRLWWENDLVVRVRDYVHVPYLMQDAQTKHLLTAELAQPVLTA